MSNGNTEIWEQSVQSKLTESHKMKVQSNRIISYVSTEGMHLNKQQVCYKDQSITTKWSRNQYLIASYNSTTTKVVPVCQSWISKLTVACSTSQATTNCYSSIPKRLSLTNTMIQLSPTAGLETIPERRYSLQPILRVVCMSRYIHISDK
jgi:hypothetical protein